DTGSASFPSIVAPTYSSITGRSGTVTATRNVCAAPGASAPTASFPAKASFPSMISSRLALTTTDAGCDAVSPIFLTVTVAYAASPASATSRSSATVAASDATGGAVGSAYSNAYSTSFARPASASTYSPAGSPASDSTPLSCAATVR